MLLPLLRRQRRLTLGVLVAFVLTLVAALLAAAPTRNALPLPLEICTSAGGGTVVALHERHGDAAADASADLAPGHHAGPACVLCLAWTGAPGGPVAAYRPPVPHRDPLWWLLPAPRAERFTARPPPLRAPPVWAMA